VYWTNLAAAVLLAISFILPFIPPKQFPILSLLSLAVSPLILVNILFVIYWLVQLKKRLLLSVLVLLFAHFHFDSFFVFSDKNENETYNNSLRVLSYNVRLFNAYEKNPKDNANHFISRLIREYQPDVIFVQEYFHENEIDFSDYPFNFIHYNDPKGKFGHALFSKFPMANTGAFDFKESNNNSLYADLIMKDDTLRIYNVHLQSLGIEPSVSSLQNGDKERLRNRLVQTFMKQQHQSELIHQHKEKSPYPVLICGDFNNTSFSYVYRRMKAEMKDAFVERGAGIGTTYRFDFYPMRLDYILTSNDFEILEFMTHKSSFSDHLPISASLGWN
jgi:endonuclease/exonuclease/phosphatase family metal-dependent hydrolase